MAKSHSQRTHSIQPEKPSVPVSQSPVPPSEHAEAEDTGWQSSLRIALVIWLVGFSALVVWVVIDLILGLLR